MTPPFKRLEHCSSCGDLLPDQADAFCPKCLLLLGASDIREHTSHFVRRYELIEEIGRGSGGVVFRARQLSLNRIVAVKMLLNSRLLDEEEIERFRKEAETVGRLRHPNIVAVHEVGEEKRQPWFSMDLVEGRNLAALIRDAPLAPPRAARLTRQVALAIQHAHERGVLHRDLKPSNIIVDEHDEPHVADFGLALPVTQRFFRSPDGKPVGTAGYMAPEQVKGEQPVTQASDVWALGAVLFHLLCGRPPFIGSTLNAIFDQLLTADPVRPRLLNPATPKDLETICLKCLAKLPSARYGTAQELAEELARFAEGLPIRARPISSIEKVFRWSRRRPVAAGLIAALVLALAGWGTASERARRIAVDAARQANAAASEKQRLLTHQYLDRAFESLTPEDSSKALPWLLAAWKNDGGAEGGPGAGAHPRRLEAALNAAPHLAALWSFPTHATSVHLSTNGALACVGGEDGNVIVWNTSNGESIGRWKESKPVVRCRFYSATQVLVASALDLPSARLDLISSVTLRDAVTGSVLRAWEVHGKIRSFRISPDRRYAAFATATGAVEVWDIERGTRASPTMMHLADARDVLFLQDGDRIVSSSFDHTARIWEWRTGKELDVLPHGGFVRDLQLSPDGSQLATASDDGSVRLWNIKTDTQEVDLQTGTLRGEPLRHASRVYCVAFSPDGKWLASGSSDSTARIWEAKTGAPRTSPLRHPHRVTCLAFSRDGRYLLTGTSDGLLSVWNPETGLKHFSVRQTGNIGEICWLPSNTGFLTSGLEGLARQWMLPANSPWLAELALPEAPNVLAVSTVRDEALVGLDGGQALLWPWGNRREPLVLRQPKDVVDAGFFKVKPLCYTLSRDGTARLWQVDDGREIATIESPPGGGIRSLAISHNEEELALGHSDGRCEFWNLRSAAVSTSVKFPDEIQHVVYSDGGQRFAAAFYEPDGEKPARSRFCIRAWMRTGMTLFPQPPELSGQPTALSFSPDGELLASSSTSGSSWVIEVRSGRVLQTFNQPGEVMSVQFGANGDTLVTAGAQGVVRLWSVSTGRLITSALSQGGNARAHFSPDKKWVLTSGRDMRAFLWDASTFEPLLPPLAHQDALIGAAFSRDQSTIVTAGVDLRLRIWKLPEGKITFTQADRMSRLISGHAVDSTGTVVALTAADLQALWSEGPEL